MISRSLSIVIVAILLSLSTAHAQQPAQNLVQPQIIKIPMKGGGAFGSMYPG